MASQLNNFGLKDYVERISASAEAEVKARNVQRDQELEVWINVFEESLMETQKLKQNVQEKIANLQSSLYQENGGLARDSMKLLGAFEREFSLFESLEKRFDQVGNAAIRAGQSLERLSQERGRALEAREIVQGFVEFCRDPVSASARLEAAILSGEQRLSATQKLRRLLSLSKAIGDGANSAATSSIMTLAQKVENALLSGFHCAFEAGNTDEMRLAASQLIAFNGGTSCIQSFVNQHDFFLNPASPSMVQTKYSLPSPKVDFSQPEVVDVSLSTIFQQIVAVTEQDWQYMQEVFDEPAVVMDALLTRILQEPVQVYLEEALRQAKSHSRQAYLRCLAACYKAARGLAVDLAKVYEKLQVETASSRLDDLVQELFSPYLHPAKLIEGEAKALNEIVAIATGPLSSLLKARRTQSKTISFLNRNSTTPAPPVDLGAAHLYVFADGAELISMTETSSPNLAVLRRCLVVHAEAIARSFTLFPEHDAGPAMERLLEILLSVIGTEYLVAPLDCAIELDEFGTDNKAGFNPQHLSLAASCTSILAAIQLYFQSSLLPILVTASPTAYRHCVAIKAKVFNEVASKISLLLRKEIEGCRTHIKDVLLVGQKKTDFKPKADDDLAALSGSSQTCQQVCAFLGTVIKSALTTMESENAKLFLGELGSAFHSLLIEHIKNFTISETGALLLRNDLRSYRDVISTMGPSGKALLPSFDIICEIGNIFLMRPENLRSYLQEGLLAQLDARFTVQFVGQRADFRSAQLDKLFPEAAASTSDTISSFFALTSADL